MKFWCKFLWVSLLCQSGAYALEITADEISIDSKTNVYTLNGNAIVNHKDRTFKADLIVIYKNKEKKLPEKIIATGNVSFKADGVVITSDSCESDMKLVIFLKSVILKNNKIGIICADKARYNIETKKMDVTSKNRVKLVINKDKENMLHKKKTKK